MIKEKYHIPDNWEDIADGDACDCWASVADGYDTGCCVCDPEDLKTREVYELMIEVNKLSAEIDRMKGLA